MRSFELILVLTLVLSLLSPLKAVGHTDEGDMYASALSLFKTGQNVTPMQSGYLYGGVISSPGKVLKINLMSFALEDTLILSVNQPAHALFVTDDYLFIGTLGSPATILQIRLSDFKEIYKMTLPTGFDNVISFNIIGSYLYACLGSGQVIRLTTPSLSIVDWLTTYDNIRAQCVQYYSDYLYVTLYSRDSSVAYLEKFDAATLSFVNRMQLSFKRAAYGLLIGNMYYIPGNGFGGEENAGIMEIDLDEFREVRNEVFDIGGVTGAVDKPIKYGEYLFLNEDVAPVGRVYRVRISDFSWSYMEVTGPRLAIPQQLDNYGYFPSVNQFAQPPGPAQLFKVNLDTFKQEDVLTFSGEPGIPQIAIQPAQLTESVTLTGGVSDIDAKVPVSGATVTANGISAITNQSGGYIITSLPLGLFTISVNAAGYESKNTTLDASSSGVYTVDFQIRKIAGSSTITGTIVEAQTGNLIVGAEVTANGYATTTNLTGRYILTVQPGNYTLKVKASGYKESSQTIDARAGGAYTVNFTLTVLEDNPPDEGHPFPVTEPVAAIIIFATVITIAVWFSKRRKRSR